MITRRTALHVAAGACALLALIPFAVAYPFAWAALRLGDLAEAE